jgi:hypothetical protein
MSAVVGAAALFGETMLSFRDRATAS